MQSVYLYFTREKSEIFFIPQKPMFTPRGRRHPVVNAPSRLQVLDVPSVARERHGAEGPRPLALGIPDFVYPKC